MRCTHESHFDVRRTGSFPIGLDQNQFGKAGISSFNPSLPFGACATTEHRGREGDNSGQSTEMTVDDEKRMTEEVLPQMKKDYPAVNNPELQSYISNPDKKSFALTIYKAIPTTILSRL